MPDFLLELRSEEIPARMQAKAQDDLARLFAAELAAAGLAAGSVTTYATPRRLALIARDLPPETAAVSEEIKGPRSAAPPQALEGFLRKTGLTREQLVERDGVLFAVIDKPGRPTADVLAAAIPAIVRAFPWPKSMRWGAASLATDSPRWVRPLQGVVAIFGEEIVPVEVAGVRSSATTLGHRFHHPGPITLGGAHDYVQKLRACHVIVDAQERAQIIRTRAAELARDAGLELIEDEGLVAENAGLTEWPVPLIGRFDESFLEVPPEVIQLTARVNQKYFVCRGADGKLANAFICTANIAATDGGAKIVEGNRKVLAARLSDARFFYEQDLKVPLEEQAKKLDKIVFHEKLGTVADKGDRVAKLARWLVEEGIVTGSNPVLATNVHSFPGEGRGPVTATSQARALTRQPASELDPGLRPGGTDLPREELADLAERAARLCKADLVTGMVGEFPELQGLMGGYYAAARGEHPAVAEAIRDHYKPVGQGDEVPTAPVTVAVSLADKLDTVVGFFLEGLPPSGSRDPYALRRAAIAALSTITKLDVRVSLIAVLNFQIRSYDLPRIQAIGVELPKPLAEHIIEGVSSADSDYFEKVIRSAQDQRASRVIAILERALKARNDLLDFFADRLKVQQREAGVRHDLIDAVFALGGEDDLVRLLARVRALQAFVTTEDGANLLAGYKRAANILKKEGWTAVEGAGEKPLSYTPEPEEAALRHALDSAEPRAAAAVGAEEFEGAMAALATLRAPIDAFFDKVTVNDPDPAKREARLNLLARVRDAVHRVADFSRIEG